MSAPSHEDRAAQPAAAPSDPWPALSRRRVLLGAAGAGAAGLAAAAVAGAAAAPALAEHPRPGAPSGSASAASTASALSDPVVVHLRDAQSGEMDVFAGTRHTRVHDPDLAARLAQAAR
jgi:hypothetical protein